MPTVNDVYEQDKRRRPARPGYLGMLALLAAGAYFCFGPALWAQTSNSQTENENRSWTTTRESQSNNANPVRTTESHTETGNRTVDRQSVQLRGSDGNFEPFQDIEKESVQVDKTTVRTITRTFGRDSSGAKILVQVTEEEKQTLPSGDSKVVRATSNPDANGKLQLVQREIEETKKTGADTEETKSTVMLPSVNGGLAPAMQTQERRKRSGDNVVEFQKTTLLPDGAGKWQVGEVKQGTAKQEGKNRSAEEQVLRPDPAGKLGEISRTVSKGSEASSGEKRITVETYSTEVPGSAADGSLHLVQRATTAQHTASSGQQTTVQQTEQVNPGDPRGGLQVTTLTTDAVRSGPSGAQATHTIQVRGASGSLGVISVNTATSDNVHAIQVQIAPSDKPK